MDLAISLRPVLYAIDQRAICELRRTIVKGPNAVVGTPAMWWLVPVLAYAGWHVCAPGLALCGGLVGYCAGWLPWFGDIDRQMYFFYAATMAPFLVMGISLVSGDISITPVRAPNDAHWG